MRAYLNGDEQKTISQDKPVIIKGWIIATDDIHDATLIIADANGDVTPPNGFRVQAENDYGGASQINETCDPAITAELQGEGASATIYYEAIEWKDILKLLRVFSY